jgi:predicted  nucleic acid-binding Zn-ribbon protein
MFGFGNKQKDELDALKDRLIILERTLNSKQSALENNFHSLENAQKKTESRLDKCVHHINGFASGKMDERFGVLKKDMQNIVVNEVGSVVENKIVGIISLLTANKEDLSKLGKIVDTPPVAITEGMLTNIEKGLAAISSEIKDIKMRQKDYSGLVERLNKLEQSQKKSNELVEKFAAFFQKVEAESEIKLD